MIRIKKNIYRLTLITFFYLGVFNAISTEQDITLNNPTSFPVDI